MDDNTLPESLPDLMRNEYYNDEEIKKAVFWAYKFQYDVISEHNGHVFDAESPLGYFKDDLILPKTKVSSTNSDVVFLNNTISGFTNFKSNKIIIKWSQDQVSLFLIVLYGYNVIITRDFIRRLRYRDLRTYFILRLNFILAPIYTA